MKVSIQTILNTCFAISMTLLIYQNVQLKDSIDTLEGYSQLDTDSTFDRLDKIDETLNTIQTAYDQIELLSRSNSRYIDSVLEQVNLNQDNLDICQENVLVLFDDRDGHREQINLISEYVNDHTRRLDGIVKLLESMIR